MTRPNATSRPWASALALVLASACTVDPICFGSECPGAGPGDGFVGPDMTVSDGPGRRDLGDMRADPTCGDGLVEGDELCDDCNTTSGDGCAADCSAIEANYVCLNRAGDCTAEACFLIVECGNGVLEGEEACDDRNTAGGDGCAADCSRVEDGWACPRAGVACRAAACGDGFRVDLEECDDGNALNGDGCSGTCVLEEGFACPTPGTPCRATTCGDGVPEGTEDCDDGNLQIGDGCTPFCTTEPDCTDGDCVAECGDEVIFAPETCDDGNTRDGDGCSSTCQVEEGFSCVEVPVDPPPTVTLPIVIRDFLPACQDGNSALTAFPERSAGGPAPYGHRDFQCENEGLQTGAVEVTLDSAGKPVLRADAVNDRNFSTQENFAEWYRSDPDVNRTVVQGITLDTLVVAGTPRPGEYRFDSNSLFPLSTPIDGSAPAGFHVDGTDEATSADGAGSGQQNFFFTTEIRFFFEYEGTEVLAFSGDDDVWVFINDRLAVDIGGVHGRVDRSVTLADTAAEFGLRVGGIYEAVVFHAERHTTRSQYRLTLSNFNRAPSVCEFTCGDGIVTRFEACDDGADNGADYNGCTDSCTVAPFCGDGVVQEEFGEVCDAGTPVGSDSCAPDCQTIERRCGDGVVQPDLGEECDDGNTENNDGCDENCRRELI
ncbi:MAG: DUF4215 domain-containing protein [Myxococcota bacterium]